MHEQNVCVCTFPLTASAMSIRCFLSSLDPEDPSFLKCTPPIHLRRETEPTKGETKSASRDPPQPVSACGNDTWRLFGPTAASNFI